MITRIPGAVASRSKIVRANGFAFFNIVPSDKDADVSGQMRQCLRLVDERLSECGLDKRQVVSITVFIADMNAKGQMNEAWEEWIDPAAAPIRACIGATLDGKDLVELSIVAADS